jgi:hypothetical protein
MAVFPSSEWLTEYVDRINSSATFAEAAQTFEADISYVFEADPDQGVPRDIWCRAAFAGGRCQWAEYDVDPVQARTAMFVIRAEYARWRDIIEGRIDPIEGMLDGDLLVTGHLPTLLRHVRAADELVRLAAQVSTSFAA